MSAVEPAGSSRTLCAPHTNQTTPHQEEYGIDRESHEHHRDAAALARIDPHAASWFQLAAEHEADAAAENRARNLQLFGQHLAGSLMHRSRTRHLNGVA